MVFKLNPEMNTRQITMVEQIDLQEAELTKNKLVQSNRDLAYVALRGGGKSIQGMS